MVVSQRGVRRKGRELGLERLQRLGLNNDKMKREEKIKKSDQQKAWWERPAAPQVA